MIDRGAYGSTVSDNGVEYFVNELPIFSAVIRDAQMILDAQDKHISPFSRGVVETFEDIFKYVPADGTADQQAIDAVLDTLLENFMGTSEVGALDQAYKTVQDEFMNRLAEFNSLAANLSAVDQQRIRANNDVFSALINVTGKMEKVLFLKGFIYEKAFQAGLDPQDALDAFIARRDELAQQTGDPFAAFTRAMREELDDFLARPGVDPFSEENRNALTERIEDIQNAIRLIEALKRGEVIDPETGATTGMVPIAKAYFERRDLRGNVVGVDTFIDGAAESIAEINSDTFLLVIENIGNRQFRKIQSSFNVTKLTREGRQNEIPRDNPNDNLTHVRITGGLRAVIDYRISESIYTDIYFAREDIDKGMIYLEQDDGEADRFADTARMGRRARLAQGLGIWEKAVANTANVPAYAAWHEFALNMVEQLNGWIALENRNYDFVRKQLAFYLSGAHFITPGRPLLDTARALDAEKERLLNRDMVLLARATEIQIPDLKDRIPVIPIASDDRDIVTISEGRAFLQGRAFGGIATANAYLQQVKQTEAGSGFTAALDRLIANN
jgi:hypothetical protein